MVEKMIPWVEKYRPRKFGDFIGNIDDIKNLVKAPLALPHFLFVNPHPGTGKTSLAKVICYEMGVSWDDVLIMNSSDERKIESIRGIVKDFAMTLRRKKDVPKIVIMDEFDGMLSASQDALRFLMERYSTNCKFFLTANDETKVIEPIVSRCTIIRLNNTDKESIFRRLLNIMANENISSFNADALKKIIDIHYPDMRSMINHLQLLAPNITFERVKTETELEEQYFQLLDKDTLYNARKFFIENGLNPVNTLKFCFHKLIEMKLVTNDMIYYTGEIAYRMRMGADSEIEMYCWTVKYKEVMK